MDLHGQVAVISGGLGDIGRAIARALAESGADVGIGDVLQESEAEGSLGELRGIGRRVRYDQADVSDHQAVERWLDSVQENLGTPTIVIPNAAVVSLTPFRKVTVDQWNRQMRVNLDGAFFLAQGGALRMLSAGIRGRIVFVGSWGGHAPQTHIPAYCVSKAGLRMLCKVMALDLAPDGILVNEVAPGNVDAGLSTRVFEENPVWRERNEKRVPIGIMSSADDIARQVAWLCDPENTQITGSTLLVDGGLSLLSGRMDSDD